MNRGRKTKKRDEKDEVDELLQAAQDDMMLSLSVDTHITSLSDLDRRFNALKLKAKSTPPASKSSDSNSSSSNSNSKSGPVAAAIPSSCSIQVDEELKAVLGDDLSTRFAALKASSSMPSSSSTMIMDIPEENDDDEDEVEKLMRWAKDAARLDPSPPSDDEDDE